MDFQEIYMSFKHNGHTHTLCGIQENTPTIIKSHKMEKLLKKGHHGVVGQFNVIQAIESIPSYIYPYLQNVLIHHVQVFEKSKELPPSRGEHDHSIPLTPGSQPPNVQPYRYPFVQKNEIEKIIKELIEASTIHPNTSPYSSAMVTVLKKDGE